VSTDETKAKAKTNKTTEPMTDEEAREVVGGARPESISNEEAERQSFNRWYYRTGGSAPRLYGRGG